MNTAKKSLKILSIGNSFSVDTMHHLPTVAKSLGFAEIVLGNLYIGGCSLNRHFKNAENDLPAYKYYRSDGGAWSETPDVRISEAISEADWDVISIQHGTADGSRYTNPASYEKLPALVQYVKEHAPSHTKIAFNMTWVGEPYHHHEEIRAHGGDQMLIYRKITELTSTLVKNTEGLDIISPTGTAIQNARTTALADSLSRDGYHLSYGTGRYIASLTFLSALTGTDISGVTWKPESTDDEGLRIAIAAAEHAVREPFRVTEL